MSPGKIVLLVIYAVLAVFAFVQPGTPVGEWSLRILMILVLVHCLEVMVFFKACRAAGGSLPVHLLNVFLFGVLHMKDIKDAGSAP